MPIVDRRASPVLRARDHLESDFIAVPFGADDSGVEQHAQVFDDGLPGDGVVAGQNRSATRSRCCQAVDQITSGRVGQRRKHLRR
jgi:hypothetical protein